MYKIPLTPLPNQTFSCVIPINGDNVNIRFFLWYNEEAGYWLMSARKANDQADLFTNIPLVSSEYGFWNNLVQLDYLRIGKMYITMAEYDEASMPNDKNLGSAYILLWGDNDS